MKKEQRLIYLTLTKEIHCPLCIVCKNGESESDGCCSGYSYCVHPIENLCSQREDGLEPGEDCWGFYPDMSVDILADLVSSIISQGYDEFGWIRYSRTSLTVYGRSYDNRIEKTSKVRIGHSGKPKVSV